MFLTIRSPQIFAHVTTAVLSWHVQNFMVTIESWFEWKYYVFSLDLFCAWQISGKMGPCVQSVIKWGARDGFGYRLSQWEVTLPCNVIFHWLSSSLELYLGGCGQNCATLILQLWVSCFPYIPAGLILGLHPANERCCCKVTQSPIGWAQT